MYAQEKLAELMHAPPGDPYRAMEVAIKAAKHFTESEAEKEESESRAEQKMSLEEAQGVVINFIQQTSGEKRNTSDGRGAERGVTDE